MDHNELRMRMAMHLRRENHHYGGMMPLNRAIAWLGFLDGLIHREYEQYKEEKRLTYEDYFYLKSFIPEYGQVEALWHDGVPESLEEIPCEKELMALEPKEIAQEYHDGERFINPPATKPKFINGKLPVDLGQDDAESAGLTKFADLPTREPDRFIDGVPTADRVLDVVEFNTPRQVAAFIVDAEYQLINYKKHRPQLILTHTCDESYFDTRLGMTLFLSEHNRSTWLKVFFVDRRLGEMREALHIPDPEFFSDFFDRQGNRIR